MSDLEEAIRIARHAVATTPESHHDRARLLYNLGISLSDLYSKTGSVAKLEEAIKFKRQATYTTPDDHPNKAKWLNDLALGLRDLYSRTGVIEYLDEAIQVARKAVNTTSEDHLYRARCLSNLGIALGEQYSRTGAMADLEEALRVSRRAVDTTPDDYPDKAALLSNLAIGLSDMHKNTGASAYLEEAIQVARQAVDMAALDCPGRHRFLHTLANQLRNRYYRTGAMPDLEESILVTRQAVDTTPNNHPDKAEGLNNLGIALAGRNSRTGAMADLEESIHVTRQALDMTPEDYVARARWLSNLAIGLSDLHFRTGAMTDLEEAIQVARQAVDATPEYHSDRARRLSSLGGVLSDRYTRTGEIADLKEGIEVARQAVEATPEEHPDRARRLSNLALGLVRLYSRTGVTSDIEDAIRIARQAVDTTPKNHPDRANRLSSLGVVLNDLYIKSAAMANLEEAIQVTRQAVEATPEDHPERAQRLFNLGLGLGDRYSRTRSLADLKEGILSHKSALHQSSSRSITRILAGKKLLKYCAVSSNWQDAYEYSTIAVKLIPKLTLRSLENSDKQYLLSQAVTLACDAAAVALFAENPPSVALKLLEQGRGVLATSLEEMRIDVFDLQTMRPELADEFIRLRDLSEAPAKQNMYSVTENHTFSPHSSAMQRSTIGRKLDELIIEIRKQPGLESFLLPPNEEDMQAAASFGPIVVVNISEHRCDALIVEQHQIRSLPLYDLNSEELDEKAQRGNLGSSETLSWLWDAIANPILETLGFKQPPSTDNWPHIWWIPTGPLTKFPLHAAGRHYAGSNETVLDRVMSTYSSSVKEIINSRRRRIIDGTPRSPPQALLVALQDTPGCSRLPFVNKEIEVLRALLDPTALDAIEPKRRKEEIISLLPTCKIFHFAGHGYTDDKDPSQSSLLLEDWQSDRLTVANLMKMNLRERSPFLAYLSACGTGEIRDKRFFDESIHLISACQLAGFRHVIGTLWEVNDESCVEMARITYEEMTNGGMTDATVCLGLHKATRRLRDQWLAQESTREFKSKKSACIHMGKSEMGALTSRDSGPLDTMVSRDAALMTEPPSHWAPYVHYGV